MKFNIRNPFLRRILGIFLMLLGCLGGFLPVMPGFVFFFMGLSLISVDFAKEMKKIIQRYKCHKSILKMGKETFTAAYTTFKNNAINIIKPKKDN